MGMYSVMGAFSMRAYRVFRKLHAHRAFDVVHDNQVLGYGSLLIHALGVPVVATVHHPLDVDRQNRIRQSRNLRQQVESALFYPFFMQGLVARRLDRIVTVSGHAARAVTDALRLEPSRVEVVANGVDVELFRPRPEIERRPHSVLAVMNSEDRNKGAHVLMEALRRLKETGRAFQLTLVDQHEERLRLVPALARQYDLANVRYTGPLSGEDLVREYNSAQVFVSPSLYEGFGLPAAEALACGAAVVATTAGAAPELIEDGVSGLLVPPGDAGALTAAIAGLLDDPLRCDRLGAAARQRIVERFTWAQAAERLDALYRDVICERTAARKAKPGA
jgi:glycosyltransferase involved in cell wall biosynthesis